MLCGTVRDQPSQPLIPDNLKIAQVGHDVDDSLGNRRGPARTAGGSERLRGRQIEKENGG
jgi:hypothetical protein